MSFPARGGNTLKRTNAALSAVSAALLLVVAMAPQAVSAAEPRGTILGANAPDAVDGSYIVVLKESGISRGGQQVASAADSLTRQYGGKANFKYADALLGFAMSATAAEAERLAADPSVAYVEQDRLNHIEDTQPNATWGLDRIDQRSLPLNSTYNYSTTASNVTAYMIDGGIRISHKDFGGRASYGYDFVDGDSVAQDCNGHGTHTAGSVGSATYGVAKGVSLVAVRVTDCGGSGTNSQVIAGYDWVARNADGPSVANASIGGSPTDAKDAAIRGVVDAGVTVAVSAGNGDTNACNQSPARVPSVITVAATSKTDARSDYSNYGSCVDIFAPGDSILSLGISSDTATATMSGTSMSSPHVAGAAALYLASHPSASPAEVTSALNTAATTGKVTDPGSNSPNRLLYTAADDTPPGTTVYSDNFDTATGWTANPAGTDTATTGRFERGIPQQTFSTYSDQIKQLSSSWGLVTGAAAGASWGTNDVDGGVTSIRSPQITIPAAGTSTLTFGYSVAHGDNSGSNDYLRVSVVDGTTITTVFERGGAASEVAGSWRDGSVSLSAYAGKTVRLLVSAADAGTPSLFEAQVDDVKIVNNS
ncbi:S8 family serine peptidase [Saccharothrix ecbatanensis]|uniref:S8 family serine peptidase n=1 Tax=Saccharothrix ecbatanensis TaxID=1105145 RepID=UPI0028ACE7FF|nr:S8 family serine peptidase [Saccharothrix ecbatanensis]